ncbi:MAG TPA: DNA-binding domain-containing protein [Thermoanaerobaculia bacterium]|nr:DNA-binding domain-containing protein [Thermoanaerobaculia bacterium]
MKPGRPARPPAPPAGPDLDVVQQWFQAVISHPGGVAGGLDSEEAQRRLSVREVGAVVAPSRHLSAEERLGIYAHAYYARLLECLADSFPVLRYALGGEVFESFAFEYLQRYPSRSYTLDRLGEDFPRFLDETRPDRDDADPAADAANTGNLADASDMEAPAWPDFLVDLARLEWAIAKVFDGPGVEFQSLLQPEDLEALGPERFAAARLTPVPCLRLLAFRYPVNAYYTAVRRAEEGEEVPLPAPASEHVALTRTDFVVRRYPLTRTQHALLQALANGARVAGAIAQSAETAESAETTDEALAAELRESFRLFAAQGFFQSVG